jgi:AbrB family looped-hinge helix DNA binding protein
MIVSSDKTQMGAHGRVVIPAGMRRELGLAPGDELVARLVGKAIVLERPEDLLEKIQAGWQSAAGDSGLVDELIAERRGAAAQEQQELEQWAKSRSSTRRR